jgi:hypothetical protein
MSSNQSFIRKVVYIAAIALLLIPLSIMSRPATSKKVGERFEVNPGGVLANMREAAGLSQARLGEIDPASEAMKLATLGMRGIAVNFLWEQANEYKRKKNWDKLTVSLEQISRLQPNFVSVWEFQAHNMSYNVSVEFDDYRQRYHWVKKGIDYLFEGIVFNRDEPRLLWYAGWMIGQKFGRSDERVQFRRMYRNDEDFHRLLLKQQIDLEETKVDGKPDNWLTGRLWFIKAQNAVNQGKSLRGKSPAVFHSSPVMSRINFVSDEEREPNFNMENTRTQWRMAGEEWTEFGKRPIPTSMGFNVLLNELENKADDINSKLKELEALAPGARERISNERKKALAPDYLAALEKPAEQRNSTEQVKAAAAQERIQPSLDDLANSAAKEEIVRARRLAKEIFFDLEYQRLCATSRRVVNFEFWRDRCKSGLTEVNALARKRMYEAKEAYAKPDLQGAHDKFEQSFHAWAQVFKDYPSLYEDADNSDIVDAVEVYTRVREQLDLRDTAGGVLPRDFPLVELVKKRDRLDLLRFMKQETPPAANQPASKESTPATETKPAPEAKTATTESTETKSEDSKPADTKPTETQPEKTTAETPVETPAAK